MSFGLRGMLKFCRHMLFRLLYVCLFKTELKEVCIMRVLYEWFKSFRRFREEVVAIPYLAYIT